jgi:hypothetical protein
VTPDKCVVCPAHGTAFDLKTGEVKGEWCPKVRWCTGLGMLWSRFRFSQAQPLTLTGSQPPHSDLPQSQLCQPLTEVTGRYQTDRQTNVFGPCLDTACVYVLQFPTLPLVGKLNTAKPLPVFESRVDEAGNIEVLV